MHEQIIYYKIKTRKEIYELIIYMIYLYWCDVKSLVVLCYPIILLAPTSIILYLFLGMEIIIYKWKYNTILTKSADDIILLGADLRAPPRVANCMRFGYTAKLWIIYMWCDESESTCSHMPPTRLPKRRPVSSIRDCGWMSWPSIL